MSSITYLRGDIDAATDRWIRDEPLSTHDLEVLKVYHGFLVKQEAALRQTLAIHAAEQSVSEVLN